MKLSTQFAVPQSWIVVPPCDSRPTNCSTFCRQWTSVGLCGTASVRSAIIIAVIIGRTCCGNAGTGATAHNEVAIGICEGRPLDALWFAWRWIFSIISDVIAHFWHPGNSLGIPCTSRNCWLHKKVLIQSANCKIFLTIPLASRIYKLLAIARLCVEPPTITVSAAVALKDKHLLCSFLFIIR